MRIHKILTLLLALIFLTALLASCAPKHGATPGAVTSGDSAKTTAWKVLMTDKRAFEAAFKALGELDRQGKIPPAMVTQAVSLGNKYRSLHNLAVQTLLDGGALNLELVSQALQTFTDFIAPYLAKGV
jgi:hypothetical protein